MRVQEVKGPSSSTESSSGSGRERRKVGSKSHKKGNSREVSRVRDLLSLLSRRRRSELSALSSSEEEPQRELMSLKNYSTIDDGKVELDKIPKVDVGYGKAIPKMKFVTKPARKGLELSHITDKAVNGRVIKKLFDRRMSGLTIKHLSSDDYGADREDQTL